MKLSELKYELTDAYSRKTSQCLNLQGSDNPQAIELLQKASAECDVLCAILDRLDGNRIALKLL